MQLTENIQEADTPRSRVADQSGSKAGINLPNGPPNYYYLW